MYLALRRLPLQRGSHIRVHCDNTTAVNCLNRQGSARSKPLNSWVISILQLLQKRDLAITVFHVAGVQNVLADSLSRPNPVSSEWALDDYSFDLICQRFGTPSIDLFATRYNRKVPLFVSPVRDVEALAVDAFSLDWNQWNSLYIFPPVNILMRVLSYLDSYQGTTLLVTPMWPNQNWFPLVLAKARDRLVLSEPKLHQRIGTEIFWCKSSALKELVCWIL